MKKLIAMLSVSSVLLYVAPAFAMPGPPPSIPEPSTFALLGLGAVGLAAYKKFKK